MTKRIAWNDAWTFTPQFDEAFLKGEKVGATVDLPHTCAQTPLHYFDESVYQMLCGYRKTFFVPEEWRDKRVFVRFGAAGHRAVVYLNGKEIASHSCGYTAFEAELTQGLRIGEEASLVVSVDSRETLDQPPFGFVIDYMTFGGLYREVELLVREKTFIQEVFVQPDLPEGQGLVQANDGAEQIRKKTFRGGVRVSLTVQGQDAERVALRVLDAEGERVLAEEEGAYAEETGLFVAGAQVWDVLSPTLYRLEVRLLTGEKELDRQTVVFGFRRAEFTSEGLFLNGRRLQIRGLNRHQSYPYVGYAMPASQQRLDAEILKKELGCNAVRTSHYPQSQHFVDRCDELGLLVFTEIPGWQHIGGEAWKAQALENVCEMVTQYRNHPSVILWGVRINESQDCDELYEKTNLQAHLLDPTRQTGGVRYIKKSSLLEDVYTYNDFLHDGSAPGCENPKKVTPDLKKGYLVTEYGGHMYPTKSYDSEAHRLEHALRHARVLNAVAGYPQIAGSFGWCMFDYNTHKDFGSGDRVCYHGVTDAFRNPKMAAAVYASFGSEPFLEVSGSMDIGEHPGGYRGKLFVFTNADSVRVYKNGNFIKEFTHADSPFSRLPCAPIDVDDLIGEQIKAEGFSPAKEKLVRDALNLFARCGGKNLPLRFYWKMLRAMVLYRMKYADAYALYGKYLGNWGDASVVYRFEAIKDGKIIKTVEKTPMRSAHLQALPDRTEVRFGDSYEVVSVRLRVKDENGNLLPFFMGQARVKIEGPMAILGPEDAAIEGGNGGLYLRTTGGEGDVRVTLTLYGCEGVSFSLQVKKDSAG